MIRGRRTATLPGSHAQIEEHVALHSAYRATRVRTTGTSFDDAMLRTRFGPTRGHRGCVLVALAGDVRVRHSGGACVLAPGGFVVLARRDAFSLAYAGPRVELVGIEWEPSRFAAAPSVPFACGQLDRREAAALRTAWNLLADGASPLCGAVGLAATLDVLRAAGVPFTRHDPRELVEPVDPAVAATGCTVDDLLSNLAARPTLSDLATQIGRSERQTSRLLATHCRHYDEPSTTWREILVRRRVFVAAVLMSAQGATTDAVAAALGYGSAEAFCHALAKCGLPSPAVLGQRMREAA